MSYKRERQHRGEQATKDSQDSAQLAPGAMTLVEAQFGAAQRRQRQHETITSERTSHRRTEPDPWASVEGLHFQPGETLDAFSDVIQGIAVQRKAAGRAGEGRGAAQAVERASYDTGAPLPVDLRERFESSLGANLSEVRIHTGSASASAAATVGAKAYTTGQDIHFAAGTYDPSSKPGQQLLAHEVAHTVQQSGASARGPQFKLNVSQPGDSLEQEADQAADAMVAGRPAAVGKGTATGVLARQMAEDVCSGPNAPLVCAPQDPIPFDPRQPQTPVPPPFDVNVPMGAQCVTPPAPLNWTTAPALAASPSEAMTAPPIYKAEFEAENLSPYKAAFDSSWSELRTSFNGLVALHSVYKDKETEVIPLLQVNPGRPVGAGLQHVDATKSFDGAKLKAPLGKVDASKLAPELRAQIFKARDRVKLSELEIANKRDLVTNANDTLTQAANSVVIAANSVEIVKSDTEIENLQLDKEQVKRDLENFKAKTKAAVESIKTIASVVNCWSDPTKLFGNIVGAASQATTAGGATLDLVKTLDANEKIGKLDGEIRSLKNYKGGLLATNAQIAMNNAVIEVEKRANEAKIAVRQMEAASLSYRDAYREMSQLMEKAGAASGLSPKDRKALAGAVEAVPKIETILEQLQGMEQGLQVPPYSEASGIGAAMASNIGTFTHALSILKGNKEYVAELKALWEGRRASVIAVMSQSMSVAGDDL